MPSLYLLAAPQDRQEHGLLSTLAEGLRRQASERGITVREAAEHYRVGERALVFRIGVGPSCGTGVCAQLWYAPDFPRSARLAGQIAACLQEVCPAFVETCPGEQAPIPAIRLELSDEQDWMADDLHSLAKAMAQAVDTYFTRPDRQTVMQTATTESGGAMQAVYAGPTPDAPVVARVADGECLQVQGASQEWLRVRFGQNEGYVPRDFVTLHYSYRGIAPDL